MKKKNLLLRTTSLGKYLLYITFFAITFQFLDLNKSDASQKITFIESDIKSTRVSLAPIEPISRNKIRLLKTEASQAEPIQPRFIDGEINSDSPVEFGNGSRANVHPVTAPPNSHIHIHATSSDITPFIAIINDGELLTSSKYIDNLSSHLFFSFPPDGGTFNVVVANKEGQPGSYRLQVVSGLAERLVIWGNQLASFDLATFAGTGSVEFSVLLPNISMGREILTTLLGESHPDTLSSTNNLAAVYLFKGDRNIARGLWEDGLTASQETVDKEHAIVDAIQENLSSYFE